MTENEISYLIRGAIFKVYNALGPGLLESAYEAVLIYELIHMGLTVISQQAVPLIYCGEKIDVAYRLDLLVEDKVFVEIKSVSVLTEVHHLQLLTYLRLSGKKLGLLVNFNTDDIGKSIFRKVNKL
ncbi:MAG: GxxExxY protein [Bacteroidota bacterium]